MFQYFPKINYGFSGGSVTVTDIFKSVNIKFDRPDAVLTTTALPGERPDQLSDRLYQTPQYYWSLLLTNGARNPFRDWMQTQQSYINQIESEYSGWVYQFGNTSQFLPAEGSTGFNGTALSRYEGTDLSDIESGDLIIYETGSGPFSIKCYGAGGVSGSSVCGSPQHGQSVVPPQFARQQNIVQIDAGDNFTTCLDVDGYIYAWGDIDLSLQFDRYGTLYKSRSKGYTWIDASAKRIIGVNSSSYMECFGGFGECSDFNSYAADTTPNVKKTSWTSGKNGGVAILKDGSAVGYGYSPPASLDQVECGLGYCVGVLPTTFGLTAFGADAGNGNKNVPSGVTGITMIAVSYTHALAVTNTGSVYAWGNDSDSQVSNTPSGTFKRVAAGQLHSAAVDTNGNVQIWGNIVKYGTVGAPTCPGVTLTKVSPGSVQGVFSDVVSGYNHVVLQGSGTNKKYIGVVDSVDSVYKRAFVKTYQFPDTTPVILNDPSGTVVSVWRWNGTAQKYQQVKVIQHQLLSIHKYLDSTKYISQSGQIVTITPSNWQTLYISGYTNAANNSDFITLRKELMDIDLYNKTQIKQISLSGVKNLETAIQTLFTDNTTNEIKISDL